LLVTILGLLLVELLWNLQFKAAVTFLPGDGGRNVSFEFDCQSKPIAAPTLHVLVINALYMLTQMLLCEMIAPSQTNMFTGTVAMCDTKDIAGALEF